LQFLGRQLQISDGAKCNENFISVLNFPQIKIFALNFVLLKDILPLEGKFFDRLKLRFSCHDATTLFTSW